MPSSFSRLSGTARRRLVVAGAGVLTIAAVGAGTTAAFAAGSTPSPSASSSSSTHEYPAVGAIFRQLPHALRADFKTLKKDSDSAKAGERADIKKKALEGAYGAEIGRVAHLFAGSSAGKVTSVVPASMKADLKTLRGDAKGSAARTAEVATIWKKALGGSYGSTIETAAKAAEARHAKHAQHQG